MDEQRAYRWWWVQYPSGTIAVVDTADRDLGAAHRDAKVAPPLGYAPCVCPPMRPRERRPRSDTPAEGQA
jgi:hypothetical protein